MTEQEKRIEDLKEFFNMIAPHIIGHRSASALFWVSVDGLSKELASLRSELAEKDKKVEEWITNWNHLDKMYTHQKAVCEAADKVIECSEGSPDYWKAFNVYDQLKNTKP